MLNKLLSYFGYIHISNIRDLSKDPYTNDEIEQLLINIVGDLHADNIDKESEKKLFKDLSNVDGIFDYFNSVLKMDKHRYFIATSPLEQLQARGAFVRTQYLKQRLTKDVEKKIKGDKILKNPRYA